MNKKPVNAKPVYLYDEDMNFIQKFETTQECADYFDKEKDYILHNLKYCRRIRKDDKWFIIKRERV